MGPELWGLLQKYRFYERSEEELNKSNFELFLGDILRQIEGRCD